jgi:glycosyltransferase involved in cell wall biosynthesis
MKILHYKPTIRLEEGGVVRAVLDMCTEMAGAGHSVVLASADPADAPQAWKDGDAGCPSVLAVTDARDPTRCDALRRALESVDVVHLHAVWQPTNLKIAKACRRLGKPYIVSVHGMLDDWTIGQKHLKKRVFLALGGGAYLSHAAVVHATAEAELGQARKWIGGAPGKVVPLLFDLRDFADLPGPGPALARFPQINTTAPRLLFLSRIHYKKGVDRLLRAAAILRDRGVAFQLLIAGTGDEPYTSQMHALRDQLTLQRHAEFLGFVSGIEKVSLYQASTAFVLPTSQENFGFVYFEALACGRPVVTTKGTDTWPEIESSGGGVIASGEPEPFADAIAGLLAEGDAAIGQRGELARAWTLDYFQPARIVEAYEALYRGAIGKENA